MCYRVFIVGAGFSHYLSGKQFPLGSQLSKIVHDLKITDLERHFQECDHEQPHLEEILTKLYLDRHIHKTRKEEIAKKIYGAVQKKLLVKDVDQAVIEKSKELVRSLFKKNDVIITTNYDLLLDHLLDSAGLWSPLSNGYGNAVKNDDGLFSPDCKSVNQGLSNIRLLKVHGSFNFFQQYCIPSNNLSSLISVLINDAHPDYWDRTDLFGSVKLIHHDSGEKSKPAITFPTYIRPYAFNRTCMKMWHEAQEVMRHASVISIIGYSFPEPDQMMQFLLSSPDAYEFLERIEKIKINILNTEGAIKDIESKITGQIRANQYDHVEWGRFELDLDSPDKAYEDFLTFLSSDVA